jgi:hypothetical protein
VTKIDNPWAVTFWSLLLSRLEFTVSQRFILTLAEQ